MRMAQYDQGKHQNLQPSSADVVSSVQIEGEEVRDARR